MYNVNIPDFIVKWQDERKQEQEQAKRQEEQEKALEKAENRGILKGATYTIIVIIFLAIFEAIEILL